MLVLLNECAVGDLVLDSIDDGNRIVLVIIITTNSTSVKVVMHFRRRDDDDDRPCFGDFRTGDCCCCCPFIIYTEFSALRVHRIKEGDAKRKPSLTVHLCFVVSWSVFCCCAFCLHRSSGHQSVCQPTDKGIKGDFTAISFWKLRRTDVNERSCA